MKKRMTRFSLNFALRELRHNKKLFRGTFLLMLFTSFLLAVVFTLGDSIAKTAVEQRFDAYGSYRYYSDSAQLSITRGQISLLGEEAAGGAVGFIDEAARSMGRVRCQEGRLPENENEAAVELGALSSMGYSYDLGQEIKLAVYLYTADGLSPEAVTKTVTLCGTLQDRSALWAAKLPSIFLTRGGGKELLHTFSLWERRGAFPSCLSGGQQQRVAVARALITRPAVILADEPTGNLDYKTGLEVMGALKLSKKRFNQTVILVTHDMENAAMAQRTLTLEDGKIAGDTGGIDG